MYRYMVRDARGVINTNQSIINALNAFSGIENKVIGLEIVPVAGANNCFALIFNQEEATKSFLAAHPHLGELDLTEADHPKILLNHEESFIYLFATILKTQELLTDPRVPPFARVNLMERFAVQALEPFIFHGPRKEEMKAGLFPIRFKEGRIHVALRGQMPKHSNTIISYNDFDALALVCFTDVEKAANLPALKHLLHSVRKQHVLSRFRGSDLDQQLSFHPLKIHAITIDGSRKKLFIDIATERFQPGTLEEISEFKRLLQQVFGEQIRVIHSLHWGRSALEIIPNERFIFSAADIELLKKVFQEKADLCFFALTKIKLSAVISNELNFLQPQDGEVHYSFEDIEELNESFRDSVTYTVLNDPIVVDNSGISFSSKTIQDLLEKRTRINPQTRQPIADAFRENKLINILKEHYSRVPAHVFPPMLEGITKAVILPNGETYDKASIIELLLSQNGIAPEAIQADTQITLGDGETITWADVWPNLAVQNIIDFYNCSLRLNRDERVLEHANPMVSLAATVSSLLDSPAALSKEEAERLMEENPAALPVHVIWSSAPAGLRLSFKSYELERLILTLLTRSNIPVTSSDAMTPYKKCIFLSGETEEGKSHIKKLLFDILKYNREAKYFNACFTLDAFRYDSGPRAQAQRQSGGAAASGTASTETEALCQERIIFNFLRAIYYGTVAEVEACYTALPSLLKRGYLSSFDEYYDGELTVDRSASGSEPVSAQISAALYVASAYTPFALLAHIAGIVPSPLEVSPEVGVDLIPLMSSASPNALLAPGHELTAAELASPPLLGFGSTALTPTPFVAGVAGAVAAQSASGALGFFTSATTGVSVETDPATHSAPNSTMR